MLFYSKQVGKYSLCKIQKYKNSRVLEIIQDASDELYLKALVKYIEYNPIKAGITKKIGEYKWAMSSFNVEFSMLNFELVKSINFDENITEAELKEIDIVFSAKLEIVQKQYKQKLLKPPIKGSHPKMKLILILTINSIEMFNV